MGVGPFKVSSSTYDRPRVEYVDRVVEKVVEKPLPNPNPKHFRIISHHQNGKYLLVMVNYPDCTNYEGNKVLLYENVWLEDLLSQNSVDPHFSHNKRMYSPIARFVPTIKGWDMAIKFIKVLQKS